MKRKKEFDKTKEFIRPRGRTGNVDLALPSKEPTTLLGYSRKTSGW